MARTREPVTTYRQRRELPGAAHWRDGFDRFPELRPGAKLILTVASSGADLALLAGDGYRGFTAAELAAVTGMQEIQVVAHLRHLTMRHLLVPVVLEVDGPKRYRIPETAFAASRGEEPRP